MKILFLTRWYPPYAGIFIERHAQAVALYNDLVVLAVLPGEKSSGLKPVMEHAEDHPAFRVIRYYYRPSVCRISAIAGFINNLRFFLNAIAGIRHISRYYGTADLIHVHVLTRAALPAFLINLLTGKPYIISEHWTRYIPENWGYRGFARRALSQLIVRRAAAVITVSDFLRNAMQDCGLRNNRFFLIPNTIDTTLFTPAKTKVTTEKKRILHVSNFNERAKNIRSILRVVKMLREQRNDFEILLIGGDEPALGEARRYASSLGLEGPDVIFKGPIPAEELARVYRESSFLLMFSNFESFSVVIYEAISCGIPVLATACGGIPEYFKSIAGRLIPPGDEEGLMEGANFMLDHYASFDPESLQSFIEHSFGLKQVGGQFDELYKFVLMNKAP